MQKIPLYRYIRAGGGVTVSPIKPDVAYTDMLRLIADEGKVLVNGDRTTTCADVESVEGWREVDAPVEDDVAEKAAAYDILMGVSE
jgi:hypothetical protein